jgi:hypothetical protein
MHLAIHFGNYFQKPRTVENSLGVHAHALDLRNFKPLMDESDLRLIKQDGIKVVRTDLLWSAVEQPKTLLIQAGNQLAHFSNLVWRKVTGQDSAALTRLEQEEKYDFSKYDQFLAALKHQNLQPMMILGLGNPIYRPDGALSIHPQPDHPADVQHAFEEYVKAAVQHYKGQGIIWELVQQPNHNFFWAPQKNAEEYTKLAMKLLPELKALDPSAQFVAPSLAGSDLAFQESCYQAGLLNYVDAVSIHFYKNLGDTVEPPESVIDEFKKSEELVAKYKPANKEIPVLLGEWGYFRTSPTKPVNPENRVDAKLQADYAVRQYLIGLMLGSPINNWHDWKGDIFSVTDDPNNQEQQFGLVNRHLEPMLPYIKIQEMYHALQGQTFKERWPVQSNDHPNEDYLLIFESQGKKTLAAWSTRPPHSAYTEHGNILLSGTPQFIPLEEKPPVFLQGTNPALLSGLPV